MGGGRDLLDGCEITLPVREEAECTAPGKMEFALAAEEAR